MKTIELTSQQQQNLIVLIDMAVKSGGLNIAQAALELAALIQGASEKPVDA